MVLESSAAAAAKHLSTNVADRLLNSLTGVAKSKLAHLQNVMATGFESYLSRNVQRCGHIRTLIKRNEPIRLTSLYVYQSFVVSDEKEVSDDYIIDNIDHFSRIVVSGLAGSGKSMFMKYAFLRCVNNFEGRIPIFFELKSLNDRELSEGLLY